MGGKSSPAPPDYRGAAEAQGQSSKENITMQTWANRPTLNTPWGQQTWAAGAGTDPATGMPVTNWTSNINLTPESQAALNAQQRIDAGKSGGAETLLGQAVGSFQTPMQWGNLPGRATTPGVERTGTTTSTTNEPGFAGERQRIEQALFEKMRPEHQRAEETSRTRLANMGLTAGSAGYNRELERLQGLQAGERFNAMQTAGSEQARLQQMLLGQQQQAYGQQLGANQQNFGQTLQQAQFQNQQRQQAIAEEQLRRGMPLNELNALLTGAQVQNPSMPSFVPAGKAEATPYMAAAQAQGDFAAANKEQGPDIGSLIGTGVKIAGMAGMVSDRRLKKNVVPLGRGWYAFSYLWDEALHFGVMAQEVLRWNPDAVIMQSDGYYAVDYARL